MLVFEIFFFVFAFLLLCWFSLSPLQLLLLLDMLLIYNSANREVAILCNHQRSVPVSLVSIVSHFFFLIFFCVFLFCSLLMILVCKN